MKRVAFVICLILIAGAGWTQTQTKPLTSDEAVKAYKEAEKAYVDAAVEAKRADLRKNKRGIIEALANLTDAQEKAFWPVYDTHEKETIKVNDFRYATLKEFAAKYAKLTDEQALQLAAKSLEFQQKRLAERTRYMEDLKKILPGIVVARLIQLENRTDALIDIELASETPLSE